MTNAGNASSTAAAPSPQGPNRPKVHASRAPTPPACGCGLPVAFDLAAHAFFCIGCGGTKECTCRRSPFSSTTRPVNVV